MQSLKTIKCPICGKLDTWHPDNITRPFCSARCKMIDLGEWASDKRTIPGEPVDPDFVLYDNDDDLY